jgi:hypothetical protein
MRQLKPYSQEIEEKMVKYYHSLSEKERRRYAAIEAEKLGYGGISYIVRLFGCRPETVKRGYYDLQSRDLNNSGRIREEGGGRKKCLDIIEGIDEAFKRVIDRNTAGSPMNESEKWTHLTRQQIADLLCQEEQIKVSVTVIDQLLEKHNFRRRPAQKTKVTGSNPKRNEQFEKINDLIDCYQEKSNPVVSMDTKKKRK